MAYTLQFAEHIRRELLAAGTTGITQREIQQRTRTPRFTLDDIKFVLEAWRKRGWVDKYHIRSRGPTKILWRATQKLQDEWYVVPHLIHEVITGDLPPSALDAFPSGTAAPVQTNLQRLAGQPRRPRSS